VLFTNILDSLAASCLVNNTSMYTLYGRCGQYGQVNGSYTGWCVWPEWGHGNQSTRHTVKWCAEFTIVFGSVVTSWPYFLT